MLVEYWMSKPVITVDVHDTMYNLMKLFEQHSIRRAPVMQKGKLVGIISDRDLRRTTHSDAVLLETHQLVDFIKKISIKENMTPNPITVRTDQTIDEAATLLRKKRISGVPVLDTSEAVVGVITQADIFRALASLTGVEEKGIQFSLLLRDAPGTIKDVTDILRAAGGHLVSILGTYDKAPEGHRKVYIKANGIDWEQLPALKEQIQQKGKINYIIDHGADRREIL